MMNNVFDRFKVQNSLEGKTHCTSWKCQGEKWQGENKQMWIPCQSLDVKKLWISGSSTQHKPTHEFKKKKTKQKHWGSRDNRPIFLERLHWRLFDLDLESKSTRMGEDHIIHCLPLGWHVRRVVLISGGTDGGRGVIELRGSSRTQLSCAAFSFHQMRDLSLCNRLLQPCQEHI